MVYEITTDCRIDNINYKKGDIVSLSEVGQYYPSIMVPVNGSKPTVKVEKLDEPKVDEKPVEDEKLEDANVDDENPVDENATEENAVDEKPIEVAKPKAKSKKK